MTDSLLAGGQRTFKPRRCLLKAVTLVMACLGASLAGAPMAASLSFAAWGKSSPKFCQTPMLPSTGHSVFDCSGYSGGQHTTFAGQQKNFETLSQRMTSFLLCAAMCMPLYMGRKNIRKSNSLRRVITTEPIMMEALRQRLQSLAIN